MFLFRKWLSLEYSRTLIMGLLIIAVFACSLPMTHADHVIQKNEHEQSHHHYDDMTESLIDTNLLDKQNETDDRSKHQHVGMNEHNPGFLSILSSGFSLNTQTEKWRLVKLQPPYQDFLYALERPPRA